MFIFDASTRSLSMDGNLVVLRRMSSLFLNRESCSIDTPRAGILRFFSHAKVDSVQGGEVAGWLGNARCHSTLEIESDGLRPVADEYSVERLAVKHHFGMHVIRGDVSAMERCQKKFCRPVQAVMTKLLLVWLWMWVCLEPAFFFTTRSPRSRALVQQVCACDYES